MADTTGTAPVTDHRLTPRGVLPRGTQMWIMVAVALGILAIIVFTGKPEPAARVQTTPAATALQPNAERLRDYQDRLRLLDQRTREQILEQPSMPPPRPVDDDRALAAAADPLDDERKRREYESLFASNVVVSRRPDGQQLMPAPPSRIESPPVSEPGSPAPPNIDAVADAVVRATSRYAPTPPPQPAPPAAVASSSATVAPLASPSNPAAGGTPTSTGPISALGPTHRLLEGTVIDAVLTNRLEGSGAAPVHCLVTNPIFSHSGQHVLIPAGSRVLGEAKPVQAFGQARLAVVFHRLVLPNGATHSLDQFVGLNEIGDAGLRGRVNQHYGSTFGASAAVGLITGLAQFLGTGGFSRGSDRIVVIGGGVSDAAAQSTTQVMGRFLNRLPTITIQEGHRVKVYLTSDLELPAYDTTDRLTQPGIPRIPEGGRP